ncbi:MAG: glycosyltransferase [Planctomycetes bacterium]|nr:glycosyltransferase [Planctomycetota bacterium]
MPDADQNQWLPAEYEPGLVSVVIPTFNRAKLLCETLESVFKQDYRPLEIIVGDDASTDATLDRLQALRGECPDGVRLEVFTNEKVGACALRNRGAARAKGEFLMFADSDDVLHEGALSALVRGIGEADLAYGQWRDWFSEESPSRYSEPVVRECGDDLLVDLLKQQWLLPTAVLHRRASLLRVSGWDPSYPVEQDFEFMTRVALAGAQYVAVDKLVADYRRHGDSQLSAIALSERTRVTERVLRSVESALDESGWTPQRREALAWRWYREARYSWLWLRDKQRLNMLMREAYRVQASFRPPKGWYRISAKLLGYANTERLAAVARKLFR